MQMIENKFDWSKRIVRSVMCGLFCSAALGCSSGTQTADTGGMSGTGISQGSIASFGSIFVNGVEWQISNAQIEVDDVIGAETDLRVGMIVRVRGDFDAGGISGTATIVEYDDEIEGPIEDDPIPVSPGATEKRFTILGRTIFVDEFDTIFEGGASFASIARDDVIEVSGFTNGADQVHATRVELIGFFPTVDDVEFEGVVANLTKNGNGSGLFAIAGVTIEYSMTTTFTGLVETDLAEGDVVEVKGQLIVSGTDRIEAMEIELEEDDLSGEDVDELELEGIVSDFVSLADFKVSGISVDASGASIDPMGSLIMDGDRVEVKGKLVVGVLVAERVEFEDESLETVQIRAAIGAIDAGARSLTLLGVEVSIDAETQLEDERDELPNFGFDDLQIGDWVRIEAISTDAGTARAKQVKRDDAESDVRLEGPVTGLNRLVPALSVLGQPIPVDGSTAYFDALGTPLSEAEFFDDPGGVQIDDVVKITDVDAAQSDALLEADIVEMEN
jgi:hypothetical protein